MREASLAVMLLLFAGFGSAQECGPSDSETIRQLAKQVKDLQAKVEALEAREGAGGGAADTGATPAPPKLPPAAETSNENAPPASLAQEIHEWRGIQWYGFGQADYKALDQKQPELGTYGFQPGSVGNFYTGDFTLLLTSRLSDKSSVLSEIVFREGDSQQFTVDLERVLLKYDYNDRLKLSFGRYHTGIGYYNTAFHTGSWLQTTADRPLIMEFANEGGPLPTQAIGVSATGLIPFGRLGLNYMIEYGSSDTKSPNLIGEGATDENNGNHINAGLFARPESIPGLQVGGSIYHDRITDFARGPSVRLCQMIVNGHVVYVGYGFELLNEGFLIRHAYEKGALVYNMPAFYSQVSWRFRKVRPFIRYQYINANGGSLLSDILLRHGPSFGARYDFDDNIAFKTQLDHTVRKGQPDLNGVHLQLAFTF